MAIRPAPRSHPRPVMVDKNSIGPARKSNFSCPEETMFSTRPLLVLTAPPSNALGSHGILAAPFHIHSALSQLSALRKPCGLRAQPACVSLARVVGCHRESSTPPDHAEYSCINNA